MGKGPFGICLENEIPALVQPQAIGQERPVQTCPGGFNRRDGQAVPAVEQGSEVCRNPRPRDLYMESVQDSIHLVMPVFIMPEESKRIPPHAACAVFSCQEGIPGISRLTEHDG